LASSPEGLELTDVYALTIAEDVGLEVTSIELSEKQASIGWTLLPFLFCGAFAVPPKHSRRLIR
jgi:hypothetical protein